MDDKARPIHLVQQMLTVFSYLYKNQISLRDGGETLTPDITELYIEYIGLHGKFKCTVRKGITVFKGRNGSGKTELFRQMLCGLFEAFSVMHSKGILLLNKCTLVSIRETIHYYTADNKLPFSRIRLYKMNPELANKLGITECMANLGRPSKGQLALFLMMWIITLHGNKQGVVILDEATTHLDKENRERVFRVITETCKGAFIVVDHSDDSEQLGYVVVKIPAPPPIE